MNAPGRYKEWDELHLDDLKKRMNSSLSSNHPAAKKLIDSASQAAATTFAFSFVFILLLCPITRRCTYCADLIFDEEEEVRMLVPPVVRHLTGRDMDLHQASVELARLAVDKVRLSAS